MLLIMNHTPAIQGIKELLVIRVELQSLKWPIWQQFETASNC